MADYIPKNEPQLTIWLGNYSEKIETHGPTLGLTAQQVTDQQTAAGSLIELINAVEQQRTSFQNLVATKDTTKKDAVKSIRNTANSMKANSNYTDAIGQALGIKGESQEVDTENIKPGIKAQVSADGVLVKFTKKGLDGVQVYSRLKGASQWVRLGTDLHSPYLDSRPLQDGGAETREYLVRGIIGDSEVGQPSDIVSVVFGGAIV